MKCFICVNTGTVTIDTPTGKTGVKCPDCDGYGNMTLETGETLVLRYKTKEKAILATRRYLQARHYPKAKKA